MIYLDNGATTFPKPEIVSDTVNTVTRRFGANPGRGGHKLALKASEIVYNTRKSVAEFFGIQNPERVIFTLNCTTSLNIVIKGLLKEGDHVIISSYEHNAVLRPLEALKKQGITYSIADVYEADNERTLNSFRNCIRENTRLCVCTCASNVFGIKLPFESICAMCHQYGILCCVDGAQGAGIIPINLSESSIDYLCIAGHKGLYGPMGTGAIIINCDKIPDCLLEGGTGSNSANYSQPEILPDKFESGTNNLSGIAGLGAGVSFIKSKGILSVYEQEINLMKFLYDNLKASNKIELYTNRPNLNSHVPVLSFNIKDMDSEAVADILSRKYNIATRAGLHCAPLAHKTKGTLKSGTVRIVPSVYSTKNSINALLTAIYNIK